jgi:hypothetical protein
MAINRVTTTCNSCCLRVGQSEPDDYLISLNCKAHINPAAGRGDDAIKRGLNQGLIDVPGPDVPEIPPFIPKEPF